MKTKTFIRVISLVLASVMLALPVFSATELTTFVTTYDKQAYVECKVNGSNVTVSGKLAIAGVEQIWIRTAETSTLGPSSVLLDIGTLEYFSVTLPIGSGSSVPVKLFVKTSYSNGNFLGYINDEIIITNGSNGKVFKLSPVYDANVKELARWANPADFSIPEDLSTMSAFEAQYYISYDRLEAVHTSKDLYVKELSTTIATLKKLGDQIIGNETDKYEQIRALSAWVSNNIYYDYDYMEGRTATVYYYPLDVIREKHTLCEGYSRLLNALLRAQGIPSMMLATYSLGIDAADGLNPDLKPDANHSVVSAYLDGRWILLDPTWDSQNVYKYGQFNPAPMVAAYFDMSYEKFSSIHQIIERPNSEGNSPSSWALPEVQKALENNLVPNELQKKYQDKITREQFCTLVVNMILHYTNTPDLKTLVAKSGKQIQNDMFNDTKTESVLVAATLGIVNGTGNGNFTPSGTLTREQAATMLSRAADYLGISSSGEGISFADSANISSWAEDGVKFISSLVSSENSNVMGGVGDNKFSPKGSYTIEQSILTVYRLFMCK